jgi:phosphoglycerate dehydrogenase-like enzyme
VVLATILTGRTRRMIGREELEAMRDTAWLLNIGRGGLVDQPALVEALRDKRIGGAYLDVTEPEPLPPEHELWGMPNVILTPHSSWSSIRYRERTVEMLLSNLELYLAGRELRNVVDLEVGHRVT